MPWFTRVASLASVVNVLVASLGYYWPSLTLGVARGILLTGLIATLALINVIGIRQSATFVNTVTIGKLVPLLVFVAVGVYSLDVWQAVPNTAARGVEPVHDGAAAGVRLWRSMRSFLSLLAKRAIPDARSPLRCSPRFCS